MHRQYLIAAAIAASVALASPPVNAETLMDSVHARAFAAAGEGPQALRAFIQRTRMLYSLNYADYATPVPDAEIAGGYGAEVAAEFGAATEDLSEPVSGQQAADELREQIYRDMQFE